MTRIPYLKICLSIFFTFLTSGSVFGQIDDTPPLTPSPPRNWDWFGSKKNFYDTKLTEEQKAMLAPLPQDVALHGAFLKQKDTGIVRLHPRGKYEITGFTVSVDEHTKMKLPILGGGAYYTFIERTNGFGPWSEIYMDNDRLYTFVASKVLGGSGKLDDTPLTREENNPYSVRSGKALGILTKLGDVPLASVTVTTPGLDFLIRLSPPQNYAELFELSLKSSRGFAAGNFTYGSAGDITPDTTYVLRSILYPKPGIEVHPDEPYYRVRLTMLGYGGSDILVAFRIIRRHEDGSITLLWKRLEKFRKPKLKSASQKYTYSDVEQLISKGMAKGMSLSQVITFLETHNIERLNYVEVSQEAGMAPEIKGFVFAAIVEIEQKAQIFFDVYMRFAFNEKEELMNWTVQKNRRR
jgi:hypothetical protein